MAGNLTLSLLTAQSGLLANQGALELSSNNISNANTVGYSRKIPNFEQRVVNGSGAGVQIGEVQRIVDEGLLKTLRRETSSLKSLEVADSYYSRIQDTFGTPADNTSIAHAMAQITSAVEALAVSPEKIIEQSELVTRAEELSIKLQELSDTVQSLRLQSDRDIADLSVEANDLIQTLSELNTSIVQTQVTGRDTTDLQDQRDVALNRLSELMDINYFERSDGGMIIFTAGGTTLVDNLPTTLEHFAVGHVVPEHNYEEGDFTAISVTTGTNSTDITSQISSGEMFGLLDMRDSVLPDLQAQLDQLAYQLKTSVNELHNRGSSFPGLQSMTGTRAFTDSATQTISFGSSTDTKMVLMDQNGDQTAQASMVSDVLGGTGPFTIDTVATQMQTWLQANGAATASVSVNTEGKLDIALNTNSVYLGFRDETATTDGSTLSDASILFDADASGSTDETVSGFSNFFGLNDFFVDQQNSDTKQSNIVTSTFLTASSSTLAFTDSGGAMTGSPLTIAAGSSLTEIRDAINANITGVKATVVNEGSGARLRVVNDSSNTFSIAQTAGTLLTDIGMKNSTMGLSQTMSVRDDIVNSPALVSHGALQWDSNLGVAGEYFMSAGDGSIALAMAERFAQSSSFEAAGDLGAVTLNFEEYGASILSRSSNKAATTERQLGHKDTLVTNLNNKANTISGVNLDEEMANLILFERGYSASARVISVIQGMFDALEGIIR